MEPLLQIRDIQASFPSAEGRLRALNGVSLDLYQGRIFGLIGETGSGKSVLGLSIPGLLPDSAEVSGSIRFKGQELLKLHRTRLRQLRGSEIAFIPQNPATSLNPVLTIGYQLKEAIARHRSRSSRSGKSLTEQAAELLDSLHMPEPERKLRSYPFQLSGGMKQRVLAAIGMCGHPSLVIADEPTKGLDALVRAQTVEMMRSVVRQTGAAMLVITHDLHVAEALCDEIGVMYGGRIVEQGPVGELFRQPKHPYTQGLLGSMPGRGMVPIPGAAYNPADPGAGCAFVTRCRHRRAECESAVPELYPVTDPGMSTLAGTVGPASADPVRSGFEAAATAKVRCFLYAPDSRTEQDLPQRLAE
ncbi:ABC transporter ATP-binding protein [Paenibacillus filicis]|uniref:Nickel import system ATP-binding protein NikD n=1 Tax=Paenibacillus filicis TaxID=669464 RepID=A0ABU9DVE1_9BACL